MRFVEPLPEPWFDLRSKDDTSSRVRSSVEAELARELLPAHPLAGKDLVGIAKCGHCDEAIFDLRDGTFARVHLTWAMQRETPPLPMTTRYRHWDDLIAEIAEHGEGGLQ